MSFSIKVKKEIVNLEMTKIESISLLSAYLRNNSIVLEDCIIINTENLDISSFIFDKIRDLYSITPFVSVKKTFNFKKNLTYMLKINNKKDIILKDLSLINDKGYFKNIPDEYIYEDEEEKMMYLKGLFLATGSINDPNSINYHLEFLIDDYDYAIFICELLDSYYLNSKIIERKNGYVIYIKEAEKISDFLKILKSNECLMNFENMRIYRDQKNRINRINNCEQANVEKTINSALKQISEIDYIEKVVGLESIDNKLNETAIYRKKYPEASLEELSKIISIETNKKVSKSGLNHRLRKIRAIYNKIRSGN
ncbi:MAG: DNA-binding protein WhiA [Bacilli bacterium]|nr:DNA-binding protein WhiA [Bacilli bacterium]